MSQDGEMSPLSHGNIPDVILIWSFFPQFGHGIFLLRYILGGYSYNLLWEMNWSIGVGGWRL